MLTVSVFFVCVCVVGQRIFNWTQKYSEWISPQSFISKASGLLLKKGTHGNVSLFVIFSASLVLQGMSLHLTFGIALQKQHKHDLNEKSLLLSHPKKTIYAEEVW